MIGNAHRNIRSVRTKLVNLTNELQNKENEIQTDLNGQPSIDAIQNHLNLTYGDNAKMTRPSIKLAEQINKYAIQIDEIRAQDRPEAGRDVEQFLNDNHIEQANDNAVNTRVIALDAKLTDLKEQRRFERTGVHA